MPGMFDFLNNTAIGGTTTPVAEIEPGEGVGPVGSKTATTGGLTYNDLLKLLASGSAQQRQAPFAQVGQGAQPVQGQSVPVFNLSAQLPQKKQQGDSTGQIVNLLAKYYGLGG